MARTFSKRQRIALLLAADGYCQGCGVVLEGQFHADHVLPFAHGCETDTRNGQALCPACNLQKSARTPEDER